MKRYEVLLMRQLIDTVLRNDWIIFVLFLILYNFEDHCMILFEFVLMLPHVKRIYNILFKKLRIELKVLKKKKYELLCCLQKAIQFFLPLFFPYINYFREKCKYLLYLWILRETELKYCRNKLYFTFWYYNILSFKLSTWKIVTFYINICYCNQTIDV